MHRFASSQKSLRDPPKDSAVQYLLQNWVQKKKLF